VPSTAFRMKLKPGAAEEYRRRHDAIWPELVSVLREAGIYDYSIFLDPESLNLFAVLKQAPNDRRDSLPMHPVMQRWWTYMADLMVTSDEGNESDGGDERDGSDAGKKASVRPKEWPLELMFHMD
jgi:L-rhamnose mutarotase